MRSHRHNRLFTQGDLGDELRSVERSIPGKVDGIPQDQFMTLTDQQLIDHFVELLSWVPLTLYEDHAQMEKFETEVDVSAEWFSRGLDQEEVPFWIHGTKVLIHYPFIGDYGLWKLKPTRCLPSSPHAEIEKPQKDQPGQLTLTIELPHDAAPERFKKELDSYLVPTRQNIEYQREQIEKFNADLPDKLRSAISARRDRLERHEGLSRMLEIPLKPREGEPSFKPIKLEKKITRPLPPPAESGFEPEPGIPEAIYEEILRILRHVGKSFEETPQTFAIHDEEDLRNIILANLNTHYEGGATGETFRKKGKTDIRILDDDRAAFVGECTLWHGERQLQEKVSQLLGYLTWRDCKASLIIFNTSVKGFTSLLAKVPKALQNHSSIVKELDRQRDGEWRFVLRSKEDAQRLITVHVFLFNLNIE